MSNKIHQSSNTSYQIRINGAPEYYPMTLSIEAIEAYQNLCKENPGEYVDIVSIRTEIIMNQGTYHLMKKHFNQRKDHCQYCGSDACECSII